MPNTDLTPRPPISVPDGPGEVAVIHPDSGELLDLATAKPEQLADWLDAVRTWESNARSAKNAVSEAIHIHMDMDASYTIRAGDFEIRGQSPDRKVYGDGLRDALEGLVAEGLISQKACDAAAEPVTTYKARAKGLNALRKLGGRVAEVVDEHTHQDDRPRRISLSRKSP